MDRRGFIRTSWKTGVGVAAGIGGLSLVPEVKLFAQQADDFFRGPPVKDHKPTQISKRVWLIYSPDSFPTPENRGMMCNITFVVTQKGVVILDSGGSVQIGEMVIRMIKTVTDKPVVAVKSARAKPSCSRSALSMNSNGRRSGVMSSSPPIASGVPAAAR